jgi:uncharacterized protein (DUF433 family)
MVVRMRPCYNVRMDATIASHIEATPEICGGRPRIAGHRIRVQDIVVWHEQMGQSAEEIVARFPQLTLSDVYAALAYYFDHRDEIQRDMRDDVEFVADLKSRLGPGPLARKILGTDGDDPVPS